MEIYNRALALEMVGNEEELLQELEHSFVYDKVFSMAQLEELENKNPLDAAAYVHSFKGAARQICAELAAFAGQNLEDVLRGKKQGNVKELNAAFNTALSNAVDTIKKIIN